MALMARQATTRHDFSLKEMTEFLGLCCSGGLIELKCPITELEEKLQRLWSSLKDRESNNTLRTDYDSAQCIKCGDSAAFNCPEDQNSPPNHSLASQPSPLPNSVPAHSECTGDTPIISTSQNSSFVKQLSTSFTTSHHEHNGPQSTCLSQQSSFIKQPSTSFTTSHHEHNGPQSTCLSQQSSFIKQPSTSFTTSHHEHNGSCFSQHSSFIKQPSTSFTTCPLSSTRLSLSTSIFQDSSSSISQPLITNHHEQSECKGHHSDSCLSPSTSTSQNSSFIKQPSTPFVTTCHDNTHGGSFLEHKGHTPCLDSSSYSDPYCEIHTPDISFDQDSFCNGSASALGAGAGAGSSAAAEDLVLQDSSYVTGQDSVGAWDPSRLEDTSGVTEDSVQDPSRVMDTSGATLDSNQFSYNGGEDGRGGYSSSSDDGTSDEKLEQLFSEMRLRSEKKRKLSTPVTSERVMEASVQDPSRVENTSGVMEDSVQDPSRVEDTSGVTEDSVQDPLRVENTSVVTEDSVQDPSRVEDTSRVTEDSVQDPSRVEDTSGITEDLVQDPSRVEDTSGVMEDSVQDPSRVKNTSGITKDSVQDPSRVEDTSGVMEDSVQDPSRVEDTSGATEDSVQDPSRVENTSGVTEDSVQDPSRVEDTSGVMEDLVQDPSRVEDTSGITEDLIQDPSRVKNTSGVTKDSVQDPSRVEDISGVMEDSVQDPSRVEDTSGVTEDSVQDPSRVEDTSGVTEDSVQDPSRVENTSVVMDDSVQDPSKVENTSGIAEDSVQDPSRVENTSVVTDDSVQDPLKVENTSGVAEDSVQDPSRVENTSGVTEDSVQDPSRVENTSGVMEDSVQDPSRVEDTSGVMEDPLRGEDTSGIMEDLVQDPLRVEDNSVIILDSSQNSLPINAKLFDSCDEEEAHHSSDKDRKVFHDSDSEKFTSRNLPSESNTLYFSCIGGEDGRDGYSSSSDDNSSDEKLEQMFSEIRLQSERKKKVSTPVPSKRLSEFIVSDSENLSEDEEVNEVPPPSSSLAFVASPIYSTPCAPNTGLMFWGSPTFKTPRYQRRQHQGGNFPFHRPLPPKTPKTPLNQPWTPRTPFNRPSPPQPVTTPSANKRFGHYKGKMIEELFHAFNESIFDGKLPSDMEVKWNKRLRTTAGYCYYSGTESSRSARIELSCKVVDSYDRIRSTLVHEMCHAATWIIDGVRNAGHGPIWKAWADKVHSVHPGLKPVTKCHSYDIQYKHNYKCVNCNFRIQRHSKSINLATARCIYCQGRIEYIHPLKADGTPLPERKINRFAQFVKDHYNEVKKSSSPFTSHAAVMDKLKKLYNSQTT